MADLRRSPRIRRIKVRMVSRHIALLRAINVVRGRTVKMKVLREVFESLGLSNITTFIGSGNVAFQMRTRNIKSLEKNIEERLQEGLGYEVAAFVRTEAELAKIANYRPFPRSKIDAAAEFTR